MDNIRQILKEEIDNQNLKQFITSVIGYQYYADNEILGEYLSLHKVPEEFSSRDIPHIKNNTLYRGINLKNINDFYTKDLYESWTTDKDVAQSFATGYSGNGYPLVLETNINNEEILFSMDKFYQIVESKYMNLIDWDYRNGVYEFFSEAEVLIKPRKRPLPIISESNSKFHGDAGAGILPICIKTGRILLAQRSEDCNEPHTWANWGGAIDFNENPKLSAKREFQEETHFNSNIELIDAYIYTNGSFRYYNFIGLLEEEFNPILNWESENYKWVTYDELLNQPNKHFGLISLINNSNDLIKKYAIYNK